MQQRHASFAGKMLSLFLALGRLAAPLLGMPGSGFVPGLGFFLGLGFAFLRSARLQAEEWDILDEVFGEEPCNSPQFRGVDPGTHLTPGLETQIRAVQDLYSRHRSALELGERLLMEEADTFGILPVAEDFNPALLPAAEPQEAPQPPAQHWLGKVVTSPALAPLLGALALQNPATVGPAVAAFLPYVPWAVAIIGGAVLCYRAQQAWGFGATQPVDWQSTAMVVAPPSGDMVPVSEMDFADGVLRWTPAEHQLISEAGNTLIFNGNRVPDQAGLCPLPLIPFLGAPEDYAVHLSSHLLLFRSSEGCHVQPEFRSRVLTATLFSLGELTASFSGSSAALAQLRQQLVEKHRERHQCLNAADDPVARATYEALPGGYAGQKARLARELAELYIRCKGLAEALDDGLKPYDDEVRALTLVLETLQRSPPPPFQNQLPVVGFPESDAKENPLTP